MQVNVERVNREGGNKMNIEPKEANDQNNSESVNDEGKSEEFLNFERGLKAILAIPPEEATEIIRRTPYPKNEKKKRDEPEGS